MNGNWKKTKTGSINLKIYYFGQFAVGIQIKIKIKHLHLAVPPSFTVSKGTQGLKEDPYGKLSYLLNR